MHGSSTGRGDVRGTDVSTTFAPLWSYDGYEWTVEQSWSDVLGLDVLRCWDGLSGRGTDRSLLDPAVVLDHFDLLLSEYDLSPASVVALCGESVLLPLEVLS